MNNLLMFGLLILIIGYILFRKEKRSFLTAVTITTGIIILGIYILVKISEINSFTQGMALIIVYGIVPLGLLIGAILLMYNTKIMSSKEGLKLASLLSFVIGVDVLIIMSFTFIIIGFGHELNIYVNMIMLIILLTSLYFGFLFVSYLAYSFFYQKLPFKDKVDYIIVLGSGLIGDRVPPLLKSRLDKGIEIYQNQLKNGHDAKMIVSGGQGSDELVSEACAMRKYLLSQDIKDEDILVEDQSTTTYENFKFSKKLMDASDKYTCVFTTNNYHVFRASMFAKKVGLKANGVGAPTAFYFLPSALIREFIAIVVLNKWLNLTALLLIYASVISCFFTL